MMSGEEGESEKEYSALRGQGLSRQQELCGESGRRGGPMTPRRGTYRHRSRAVGSAPDFTLQNL